MVPLLKRHFNLAWCGFATESVNTRGTKSQISGQCIYKTSFIFIKLGGNRGSKWLSSGFPPSIWLGGSSGSKWLSHWCPPSPSWKSDLPVIHIRVPVSHWISPRSWWWVPGGAFSSLRATSQQKSSISYHSSLSTRSSRFVCN